MKLTRLLALCAVALLGTACHSISLTAPDGSKATVYSIGQKVTIGGLTYGAGGVKLTNYNNDQLQGLQAAFAAGAAAAKAAAAP